jgi:hypothetical protein
MKGHVYSVATPNRRIIEEVHNLSPSMDASDRSSFIFCGVSTLS